MTEPRSIELANTLQGGPHGIVDVLPDSRLRPLRDAIRALFVATIAGADPDQSAVDVINDAARSITLVWRPGEAPLPDEPAASAAASAIGVLAGPDRTLLRRCAAAPCIRLFLADDPRRRFCSPTCGTRVRAARLRERRGSRPYSTATRSTTNTSVSPGLTGPEP